MRYEFRSACWTHRHFENNTSQIEPPAIISEWYIRRATAVTLQTVPSIRSGGMLLRPLPVKVLIEVDVVAKLAAVVQLWIERMHLAFAGGILQEYALLFLLRKISGMTR